MLTGAQDVVVRDVDVSVYETLFGAKVMAKEVPGGHSFFIQDPESSAATIAAHIKGAGAI